jgi:hypothetical protein
MSRRVMLRDLASARAGDKGNTSNISLWAYDREKYELLRSVLTPELLKKKFGKLFTGDIKIYPVDHLNGMNIVINNGLEGGVNSSLNVDFHGKSFSYVILGLPVDMPEAVAGDGTAPER